MGGVDGPGVRSVIFTQGCPIRCSYCHNPETWQFKENNTSVDELVKKLNRYKPYYGSDGGVTLSGGEPLCQQEFATQLFKECKENGINTCLDTSAQASINSDILSYTDLVLCDIKFLSEQEYQNHTGGSFNKVIAFLDLCREKSVPVWIRHVVVPQITDSEEYILALKALCKSYSNIEDVKLLTYRNLCISKYEELGIPYKMADVKPLSEARMTELRKLIKQK